LIDQHLDGKSFTRLLKGKKNKKNRPLFWHYPHYGNQGGQPGSAVRYGDYKLIHFYYNDIYELYNLNEDIGEHNDLSKELPEKLEELKDILDEWRISVDAKVPSVNPGYKIPEK
jgi:arylsulfatase A-like enzyme